MQIKRVCVIGSGVMGAGIAAQVANAGFPVVLLDVVPDGATDRNMSAKAAVDRLLKNEPQALMVKSAAQLIEVGNLEDDLAKLNTCDWIIEAVTERLDVKHALYRKIEASMQTGAIVSSNTSTLKLSALTENMPAASKRNFCITHFFNPPRYMRLLELVPGPDTDKHILQSVRNFCDQALGKAVVIAHDQPGFIANRIGVYWLQCATTLAAEMGLTIEEADAVMGKPIGAPKSGVFDLFDIVGLDLMPHVDQSLRQALPKHDAYQNLPPMLPVIAKLISEGNTGRKGKGGFYRLQREGTTKTKQVIDLKTGQYRALTPATLQSIEASKRGLRELVTHNDRGGVYAWAVLSKCLAYAASLVPEVAASIHDVDLAMRTGFNWARGPFQMIDQLGAEWFAEALVKENITPPPLVLTAAKSGGFYKSGDQLASNGIYISTRAKDSALRLSDLKMGRKPLASNASASVWDVGDGVACLEFHSKMNTIDTDTMGMGMEAVDIVSKGKRALLIHNEAPHFTAGANLGLVISMMKAGDWSSIESFVKNGQDMMQRFKFAPFPVVAAPAGLALGGGCEILLHCDAVQAHAELNTGLVETLVGIIPGWGGCKELLIRKRSPTQHGPMPPIIAAFEQIATAKTAKSAAEAKQFNFLRGPDSITMNIDRLFADGKATALRLAENYQAPQPAEYRLPGASARVALSSIIESYVKLGHALPHDVVVSQHLAAVLSGGDADITVPLTENDILKLEAAYFMALCKMPQSLDRIETMLKTGKPLRN
jgi:3-hydroxyacyl-CoA dehydrogenase